MNTAKGTLPAFRWTSTDTWAFISFSMGMFLESYIFGMASIATTWVSIPPDYTAILLSWSPIWLILGIAVAGPVSDRI